MVARPRQGPGPKYAFGTWRRVTRSGHRAMRRRASPRVRRLTSCLGLLPLASCSAAATPATATAPLPQVALAPQCPPPPPPQAAPSFGVAHCEIGHTPPPIAMSVVVGEGWGCAGFGSEGGTTWQCWEASGGSPQGPRAWIVPWLKDKALQAGPDRLCEFARPDLTFRCWARPARGDVAGRELPPSWEWLNPNHAAWGETYSRSDRLGAAFVGGTFGCVQNTRFHGLWCLGDDRFAQLGGSSPVPRPDAGREDAAFVQHIWPAMTAVLGTWHGCAVAAPAGLAHDPYVACWGRGDHGQLGAPARDKCTADGVTVACARSPQRGPGIHDPFEALGLGDLFTCLGTMKGIWCWGASRDALFGVPGSCPLELRNAWPTLHGNVPAPRASCASDPTVVIPDVGNTFPRFIVGPRGLCFDRAGTLECLGGVPTPAGGRVGHVGISPGPDASACGLRDGGVVCWGEGYSPPGALDTPVPIVLEAEQPVGATAIVGGDPAPWGPGCLIHRGCTLAPAALTPCAPDVKARDWSEVLASADTLSGQTVSVRGALGVGGGSETMVACGHNCCNHAGESVVLGGASSTLGLDGFFCTGDESAQCCNAPAYGQTVLATGRLEPIASVHPGTSAWKLGGASLCAP